MISGSSAIVFINHCLFMDGIVYVVLVRTLGVCRYTYTVPHSPQLPRLLLLLIM